jgi:hypothetical protein
LIVFFTSPAKKPSVSLVVDVCATGLVDAVTYTKGAFESEAFAAAAAPVLDESLTPPLTKAYPFLEKKDPEQVRREAQRAAACEAKMEASRQLLEERHLAKDAVEQLGFSWNCLSSQSRRRRRRLKT